MPRRPGRSSRSEPRWAEPPPGIFPGGEDLLRLLAVLAIAAAVAAACSFLNRRPSPFCDSDADAHYAAAYDSCEPCPENGRCADGKLECVQGFRKRGNRCVEDGVLTQTANKIAESLQRRICDEHARALCGQPGKILYNQLEISNMADEQIYDLLKLECVWKVKDQAAGEELVARIGRALEGAGGYVPQKLAFEAPNQVRAQLYSTSLGGLSVNDFIIAAKIDQIKTNDLIPKKRVWA